MSREEFWIESGMISMMTAFQLPTWEGDLTLDTTQRCSSGGRGGVLVWLTDCMI
jgi:hypothetical protein